MADSLWTAFALVLVIEGLLPFAAPRCGARRFRRLIELTDGQMRFVGLAVRSALGLLVAARSSHMRNWLLPEAIEDVLPGEAARLEALRRALLDHFAAHALRARAVRR